MVVVSDTSVITNLLQINKIELLQQLFKKVVIPGEVYNELNRIPGHTIFLAEQEWIQILSPADNLAVEKLLIYLDKGEAQSIVLAAELQADLLLIDERKGRQIAEEMGLKIMGLIGILIKAKNIGLINFVRPLLDELIASAGFRIKEDFYNQIITLVNEK